MDAAARAELPPSADLFVAAAAKGPWPAFRPNGAIDAAAETFLRGLYEDASDDELGDLSVADFAAIAHDFWIWRGERSCDDERCIRIRRAVGVAGNALDRDVLEIAGPDMPFLVDSVMGEIAEQGISPLAMFHPIAPSATGQGRDSLIQVHLPRLSAQRAKALEEGVRASLKDVHLSVRDYQAMRQRMLECAAELQKAKTNADKADVEEGVALLNWLADNKFTFLGARDYQYRRNPDGSFIPTEPDILEDTCLGVLSDLDLYVLRTTAEPMVLTPELKRLMAEPAPLIVAKSTIHARVHRRATADYVAVKRYNEKGEATGETRFVGLFTSESFTEPTRNIPMLRRKAEWVMNEAGFAPGGHNAKALRKIIEYYPREELWQMSREELLRISKGVLHLLDRPRARVFNRRDRFNRFVTALAYLPKDSFTTDLREQVGEIIAAAYGGKVESFTPQLGEGQLARVLFVIDEIDKNRPDPNQAALDGEIAAIARTWNDRFRDEVMRTPLLAAGQHDDAANRFEDAYTAAYQERYPVEEALVDMSEILSARDDEIIRARAYRLPSDADNVMRCKFYARGDVLALSATVPILENMGLFVDSEVNFELQLAGSTLAPAQRIFVHDIETRSADGKAIDLEKAGEGFEEAFAAIWTGKAESDGFNRLIIELPCTWREAALFRALARYRQQTGLDPSQTVQEQALAAHPNIAQLMLTLFRARFCPIAPLSDDLRRARSSKFELMIEAALNEVDSLDQDRALRRMAQLITAIRRTNYYQPGPDGQPKPYMSFKIDSHAVTELPAPKPYREIWVASPQVEGVHLRFGPVARGGLRWSDRRDDFRTEVLDLVKAQQVKNAIIVPVGAKGGFYPKRLPARGASNYQEAGIDAYKTFLRGLLDITDNIVADAIVAPKDVVRWDDDDPYLVVAADKGTATFSDIANGISLEYGHWLGDAFASGGSVGYDHKAMGITAKGAWEAVKRHFREIGKDIQTTPFTVIGVGDMSGDVFGNGMLLSRKIRLLAAFDHRDIFIDPNPIDEEKTWIERKRLFDKPRSSWQDYDKALISKGGGVFSRGLKSIPISKEIEAITGLKDQATPAELMCALLRAQCELLWFGGIGAYIKARAEANADVGDKTNDALRVDAEDLRAQVIGEGANLGVTQKGRIAFARIGGRINTDAIDNSAGVDTSDHEVNIKILLGDVIRAGALKADKRDKLLESMTDEVGALVLRNNYDQTLALSLAQASAVSDLDSHERFIQRLETAGKLSRKVEGLPLAGEFASLRAAHLGLTRPELAKLVAYAKIDLFDSLVASAAPDDHAFYDPLKKYFPKELWKFEAQMHTHRLRREIIATQLANDVINVGGPTFVDRLRETSRAEPVVIACAFEAARRVFDLDALAARINALDNQAPAAVQLRLHAAIANALRRIATYMARHAGFDRETPASIDQVVRLYREPVAEQRARLWGELSAAEQARVEQKQAALVELGAPAELARDVALLGPLTNVLDVSDLARRTKWPLRTAALLHTAVGSEFGLDALREAAGALTLEQHWDRLVVRRAAEDFAETQLKLAQVAATAIGEPPKDASAEWAQTATRDWVASLGQPAVRARSAYAELDAQGPWTFAKLMLVSAELNALVGALR